MKNSISAFVILVISLPAYSGEFWANRQGGGAEDVLESKALHEVFRGRYFTDTIIPEVVDGSTLIYEVVADSYVNNLFHSNTETWIPF